MTKRLLHKLAFTEDNLDPVCLRSSVTSKKSPNVYESCPKMISLERLRILTTLQKLPKNSGSLGLPIVAIGFEKLPKD